MSVTDRTRSEVGPADSDSIYGKKKRPGIDNRAKAIMPLTSNHVSPTGFGSIRSFDTGGDVDQDQIAKLGAGETVLNPEEAQAYRDAKQNNYVEQDSQSAPLIADNSAQQAPGLRKIDTGAPPTMKPFGPQQTAEDQAKPQVAQAPDASALVSTRTPQSAGFGQIQAAPTAEDIAAQSEASGRLANHDQLQFQRNLINEDRMKAAQSGDIVGLGKAALHEQELDKQNPWGSAANHSGTFGKVMHGLAKAGNISGDIIAPGVMANVPGTDLNKQVQAQQALGLIKQGTEENYQNAETAKDYAAAAKDRAAGFGKILTPQEQLAQSKLNDSNTLGQINELLQHPDLAPADKTRLEGMQSQIYARNPELYPPERQAKEQAATETQLGDYTNRVKALQLSPAGQGVYGAAPAGSTPTQLEKRYTDAANLKNMGQKDAENQIRDQQRKDDAQDRKDAREQTREDKLVNYRDANGNLVSGTRGEAMDAGVKDSDIHGGTTPAAQEKARQAYTQYGRIIDNAQAAMDTLPAWDNESDRKAAMDVSKQYWEHVSFGLPGITAEGISPEYKQQLINSEAYRKMTPQGRENMQNMFQIWSDAINIVKQETGGVPRGQIFLQKEDAILPHPDKTADMNEKALSNLVKRIHTDAGEFARPSDMDSLKSGLMPRGAVDVKVNGKDLGYATADQQRKGTYTPWPGTSAPTSEDTDTTRRRIRK